MPQLKLRFRIDLSKPSIGAIGEPGPLFHQWLPDGKNDAVALAAPDEQEQITVWFERRTLVDRGFLRWDYGGKDFDHNIMSRQGKLEGGHLFGEMNATVSNAELAAIENKPIKLDETFGTYDPKSTDYLEAGKRVASKIQSRVERFVLRLRTQYGQYWLKDVPPWDSRRMSLGTYCSSVLSLQWQSETSVGWFRFLPTPGSQTITAQKIPGRGYAEYLTEADWRKFQAQEWKDDIDVGIQMLGTATEALDTGNWSYAFVTVASALEIALSARMKKGESHPQIKKALNRFDDQETLPGRSAVVLLACGAELDAVSAVLAAIEIRNRVVHEGARPTEQQASALRPVMQTIGKLMQIDALKTPILTNGNQLAAPPV